VLAAVALSVTITVAVTARPQSHGRVILDPPPTAVGGAQLAQPPPLGPEPPPPIDGAQSPSVPSGEHPAGTPLAPPTTRTRPAAPARPAPPATRFTAVSGVSCPRAATSGYYDKGRFTDWYGRASGGWAGDGCAGRMIAVPMSGDANVDDPDNVIVWWFRPTAPASCAISVHVPATGNGMDSAGAPATYFVYPTTNATGASIGRFDIDQVHNQGRWVPAGSYPTTGQLSVRMVTRGVDWGPGRSGAHLGVSALRVTC
jgi:hypothetical protein